MNSPHIPIFVVGSARSGTTLMQTILRDKGGLAIAPETHYFDDLRPRIADPTARLAEADRRNVEDYFLALSHREYGFSGDPEQSKVGRDLLRARADELGGSADAYFEAHCRIDFLGGDLTYESIWGEKTPRHVFRMLEMAEAYPDSRFIFMLRDPRAVVCSYANWKKKHDGPSDESVSKDLADAVALDTERVKKSYHPVVATMIWRAAVSSALRAREELGDDRVRILQYEELCASTDDVLKDLWKWLGVEKVDEEAGIALINSSFGATTQGAGMKQDAVFRWKTALSRGIQRKVSRVAGKTLVRSGYESESSILDLMFLPFDYLSAIPTVYSAVAANRSRFGNPIMYVARRARHMISG